MEEVVTTDLSKFGYVEMEEAARIIKACGEQDSDYLSDRLTLSLNMHSGNVFVCDGDYNVAMMNGDKLEQWFNCPYCGHEGFKDDMGHKPKDKECADYMGEIGAIIEG